MTSLENIKPFFLLLGEDGLGGAGLGGAGFEFGVDPNEDPELALV